MNCLNVFHFSEKPYGYTRPTLCFRSAYAIGIPTPLRPTVGRDNRCELTAETGIPSGNLPRTDDNDDRRTGVADLRIPFRHFVPRQYLKPQLEHIPVQSQIEAIFDTGDERDFRHRRFQILRIAVIERHVQSQLECSLALRQDLVGTRREKFRSFIQLGERSRRKLILTGIVARSDGCVQQGSRGRFRHLTELHRINRRLGDILCAREIEKCNRLHLRSRFANSICCVPPPG